MIYEPFLEKNPQTTDFTEPKHLTPMAESHPLHLLFIARRKTITDFLSALASSCIYLCIFFFILAVLGLELKVSNCFCVRQF
jgi:hypothetical protein